MRQHLRRFETNGISGRAVRRVKEGTSQLGCVQDTERREFSSFFLKGPEVLGSTRRARFTRAALRHANIRDNKGPSLGTIPVKSSHQRRPYAMKFENRSREETERQERCARGVAWRLAKNIYKLKETDKITFNSPSNEWSLLAPSTIKSEDSGASMHKVSRKDLNSAELGTAQVFQNSEGGCYSQRRSANKRRGISVC